MSCLLIQLPNSLSHPGPNKYNNYNKIISCIFKKAGTLKTERPDFSTLYTNITTQS